MTYTEPNLSRIHRGLGFTSYHEPVTGTGQDWYELRRQVRVIPQPIIKPDPPTIPITNVCMRLYILVIHLVPCMVGGI